MSQLVKQKFQLTPFRKILFVFLNILFAVEAVAAFV
jgi:hypothetical protein